jgi:polyhydroxybutyrate depolymerase
MQKALLLVLSIFSLLQSKSQLIVDSILVDDHYRTFRFNQPGQPGNGAALVFILHGSGGDGLGMMKGAELLEKRSATENLLLVYPDGYQNYWNECRKAAGWAANVQNIDENKFFRMMISYFRKNYRVNDKHVFAAGISGGGHMAYKLALTMPSIFKAITAIVANLPDSANMDCEPSGRPVSVMIINGTNDPLNPYQGGEMRVGGGSVGMVRSTDLTFRYWANLAGYSREPVVSYLPDTDPADGSTIVQFSFRKKRGPEVVLLEVIGGKHGYPNDINVFLYSWEFFKRHFDK